MFGVFGALQTFVSREITFAHVTGGPIDLDQDMSLQLNVSPQWKVNVQKNET